jgi:16S rRNA (cytidine1402-2'-O)-methyltransferase
VGTLYVVGAPAGHPDDITLRALRILREVVLVVAEDAGHAQRLLARHEIATPLAAASSVHALLDALRAGDVAILSVGWSSGPQGSGDQLIHSTIDHGFPIVPVPGPALPITALVISGLPADRLAYLGELPRAPSARHDLLASAASERRTLVVRESPHLLAGTLVDLCAALGDRSLVVVTASEQGIEVIWRGTLGTASEHLVDPPTHRPLVLVIGGARERPIPWDEDRLQAEIGALLDQGLGVKEISQQLTGESGWPRREIYRRAVEAANLSTGK